MAIKKGDNFYRGVSAFIDDSPGINTFQLLQVDLRDTSRKHITNISCGYNFQGGIGGVAATVQAEISHHNVIARVAVFAGLVTWDFFTESQLLLGFNPFNADIFQNIANPNVPQVLYDKIWLNQLEETFNPALIIEAGIEASVVMSAGYISEDTSQDVITVKVGTLTVGGFYELEGRLAFPYTLR